MNSTRTETEFGFVHYPRSFYQSEGGRLLCGDNSKSLSALRQKFFFFPFPCYLFIMGPHEGSVYLNHSGMQADVLSSFQMLPVVGQEREESSGVPQSGN